MHYIDICIKQNIKQTNQQTKHHKRSKSYNKQSIKHTTPKHRPKTNTQQTNTHQTKTQNKQQKTTTPKHTNIYIHTQNHDNKQTNNITQHNKTQTKQKHTTTYKTHQQQLNGHIIIIPTNNNTNKSN